MQKVSWYLPYPVLAIEHSFNVCEAWLTYAELASIVGRWKPWAIAACGHTYWPLLSPSNLELGHVNVWNIQESFRDLLGHGIFNSDGDEWKTQRKTASLEFSARSLRDLTVTAVRDEVSQRLLPTLQEVLQGIWERNNVSRMLARDSFIMEPLHLQCVVT